jgi:S1-C subfamily serine protease
MKKLLFIPTLSAILLMSSCAFTNLFTKNLLDQRRRAFVGLSKVIFNEEGRMMGMSTASGAIIHHEGDKSYVLTAKHFCEATGPEYIDQISIHTHKMENARAEVVAMAKDIDACIVSSKRVDAKKLSVANSGPDIGEKVYNMAAPQGVFGEDLVMLYEGFYSGKLVEGPLGNITADIFSLPANPGSSGSPVINGRGKLIGVVFAIHSRFHHITLSTPFEKLRSFIHQTLESKSE